MHAFVWVESWQQQCCGDEFRLGSEVRWQVKTNADADEWIDLLLGPEWASRVRFTEDHHLDEADAVLTGVVSAISVVTCDRVLGEAPTPGASGRVLVPVPGSGRLRAVEVADPWEPEPAEPDAGWSFDGWIVELTSAELAVVAANGPAATGGVMSARSDYLSCNHATVHDEVIPLRITYDGDADAAYVYLRDIEAGGIARTVAGADSTVNLDFDVEERLIGIEVLRASRFIPSDLLERIRRA